MRADVPEPRPKPGPNLSGTSGRSWLRADPTLLGQRDYAIIGLFLYSGLRVAELALLTLDQLRLEAGWLRVRGKGSKDREVPIASAIAPALRHYLAEVRPALLGDNVAGNPYVFVTHEAGWSPREGRRFRPRYLGRPLKTRTLYRLVVLRIAGILGRAVSPHKLRHSYATRLRRAGADPQMLQELLGHADLGTTMIYSHLGTEARRSEVDQLFGRTKWGPPAEARPAVRPPRRRRADANLGPHAALGDRLRVARQAAALTIEALAAKSGTGRGSLIRYERGARRPKGVMLRRVAEATGVSAAWILTGRDESTGEPDDLAPRLARVEL